MLDLILSSRLFNWFFGTMHGRDERGDAAPTRSALSALALVVLAGCGGGGAGGGGFAPSAATPAAQPATPAPAPTAPQKDCSVTIYGDSIAVNNAAIFTQLRPHWRVVNKAVAGTKLATLSRTFNNDYRNTRFVVIENGNIDSWSGVGGLILIAAALPEMLEYVKAEGRVPVITGLSRVYAHPGTLMDAAGVAGNAMFNAALKTFAAERSVAFADWATVEFAADGADVPDGIHPRDAYSVRLVQRLVETMDRIAPECRA
ncbi:SGNH/GDSL hydrolase family protein [Variovorax paradoxus]|nr:SGNH/GDSL hydrolase family protein [Variovorax paradoxus]